MRLTSTLLIIVIGLIVFALSTSKAATPPENSIPIVGLKPHYEDIDTDFFCLLSWQNFNGLSQPFYKGSDILENVVLPGDTTGMLTVVNPWRLKDIAQFYAYMNEMSANLQYALPVWKGRQVGNITYTSDGIIDNLTASEMEADMEEAATTGNTA